MIRPEMLLPVRVLLQPECIAGFLPRDWDLLIRQARAGNVLARIAVVIERAGLAVPPAPGAHLAAAAALGRQQEISAGYEIDAIRRALASTRLPLIVLKGGAYRAAGLDAAAGRLFADIDILVPAASLPDVESALIRHGWHSTHLDSYDQRYYRQWMHELPPMRHLKRGTAIDVHHTILPPTAGRRLDAGKLIAAAVPVAGDAGLRVLAPVDMVLHSMTHLFYDGELEHGFRDLVDLDSLLRQFGSATPGFWERLVPRARELDLARPLDYGLRYAAAFLGTPVPPPVRAAAAAAAPPGPAAASIDAMFMRALQPAHPSCSDRCSEISRFMLYIRAHWLRMPPHLLALHLARKALRRPPETEAAQAAVIDR